MPKLCIVTLFFLGLAVPGAAQQDRSSWGVSGSFVPRWETPEEAKVVFDADVAEVHGSEFRVGVVRGRTFGGDWGVSLVRKTFKEGSRIERGGGLSCIGSSDCAVSSTILTSNNVTLTGVEIHKFASFVTISQRVQIGMVFGGGVAQVKGTAQRRSQFPVFQQEPGTFKYRMTQGEELSPAEGREFFYNDLKTVPLGRVELAVAAIIAPGAKVRVSGGLNIPGYEVFSVTFVYLFGAR